MDMTVYFDMDGVLAVFDHAASDTKPFNVQRGHYFLRCRPDHRAIRLMRMLAGTPGVGIEVLSRIWDVPDMKDEWTQDKRAWVRAHCDLGQTVTIHVNNERGKSARLVEACPPGRDPAEHVLVDDDPVILDDWRAAGGTAVQYLQPGRLVETWSGPVITPEMDADAAFRLVRSLLPR